MIPSQDDRLRSSSLFEIFVYLARDILHVVV